MPTDNGPQRPNSIILESGALILANHDLDAVKQRQMTGEMVAYHP